MPEQPQTIAGKYEIVSVVGRGGMGTVYKAVQHSLNRVVAIKMLSEELASDIEFRARFKQEATVVARLNHPNIVGVYDIEPHEHTFCIIMEFLEGESLQARIDREVTLMEREAVHITAQVARALDYAHRQGVVHRDVKPDNIIVLKDGTAKVTDFGIARFMESKLKTQTGVSMGTPKFMSPEQVTGKNIDGQSDLYSLGVCLYYCLTGRVPFDGENPIAIATRHLYEPPPPPSSFNSSILPATEKVILRAMEKSKADRFETGAEMAEALEAIWEKPKPKVVLPAMIPGVTGTGATRRLPTQDGEPVATEKTPRTPFGSSPAPPPSPGTPTGIRRIEKQVEAEMQAATHPTPSVRTPPHLTDVVFETGAQRLTEPDIVTWTRRWWPAAAAVSLVIVGFVFAVARSGGPTPPTQPTPTPGPTATMGPALPTASDLYEQSRVEGERLIKVGRVRDAVQKWDDFAARYPDFRATDVALIRDKLAAQVPPSDARFQADRRDRKGMQFYNSDPPKLFLAKAYLEAASELYKSFRQPYPRSSQLAILDKSASASLQSLTAGDVQDRGLRADQAMMAAADLLRERSAGTEAPEAEARLIEALELEPTGFPSWSALAAYYRATGRPDDARVLLRFVEKNAPAGSEYQTQASKALREIP